MMGAAEDKGTRQEPVRQSVVTRKRAAQAGLLRLSLGPDAKPFVDLLGRAPGRGVYVECTREALLQALSPKGLGRAFRGKAAALSTDEVAAILAGTEARLDARLHDLVGIARRAGQLELGMDAALEAIRTSGPGGVVLVAEDASARSSAKVEETLLRLRDDIRPRLVRAGLKRTFGARLGRDEVGILFVRPSKLAERVRVEADRREGLQSPRPSSDTCTGPLPKDAVERPETGSEVN